MLNRSERISRVRPHDRRWLLRLRMSFLVRGDCSEGGNFRACPRLRTQESVREGESRARGEEFEAKKGEKLEVEISKALLGAKWSPGWKKYGEK